MRGKGRAPGYGYYGYGSGYGIPPQGYFPGWGRGGFGRGRGRGFGPGLGMGLGPIWQAVPFVPGTDPQTYLNQLKPEIDRRIAWHENLLNQYRSQLAALANSNDPYSLQQKTWLEQAIAFHEGRLAWLKSLATSSVNTTQQDNK